MIKLKFVGANGSMDLTHGKVYDVDVGYNPITGDFYVEWNVCGVGKRRCSYYSMQRLLANWESTDSVDDVYANAIKAMRNYLNCISEPEPTPIKPEPTPIKPQKLDIQEIINDAMEKKDRYVSIIVTNEGHMSVNVYPSEEENYVEEEDSRSKKASVRRKKLYQYNYPF